MTDSQRYKITSNNYADLIIDKNQSPNLLHTFPDTSQNEINEEFSVIHFPVENMTAESISTLGYINIPLCYGLLSVDHVTYFQTNPSTGSSIPSGLHGQGTLIGFIDTGIDYQNKAFLNTDNTTRIVSIWDQSIDSPNYPPGFFYGTEYNRNQIDEALKSPQPLSIVPSTDDIGHGTMIAGVAAGTPVPEYNFSGTAPLSDLVVVKLKEAKEYLKDFFVIPKDAYAYQENDIILGIKYLRQVADHLNKPLVIIIALGVNKGDHTGMDILGRYISEYTDEIGRAIVVAAGNEGNRGLHYYMNIPQDLNEDNVYLNVGNDDPGFTLQFWGSSPNFFWIDIYSPDGNFLSRLPPIHENIAIINYRETSIITDTLLNEPYSAEQFMLFRFHNPIPGLWRFQITAYSGDIPRQFHFWLPIHNFVHPDTKFINPNTYTTITDPGDNDKVICITAYNTTDGSLFFNASRGFAVNNHPKPDITAPGVNLICPYPDNQFVTSSATSLAAAYTAGIIALLLEWGIVEGNIPNLNNIIILNALLLTAHREDGVFYPNPDFGYGTLSTDNILDVMDQYRIN